MSNARAAGKHPLEEKYHDRLKNLPDPGGGRHHAILAVANYGVMAGIDPSQIHEDIRRAAGSSPIPDREIRAAITRAAQDHARGGSSYQIPPKPKPLVQNGQAALRRIIGHGTIRDDVDLWECSPIRLYDEPEKDRVLFLKSLFNPWDQVFIGESKDIGTIGRSIRTVAEWAAFFDAGGDAGPFIIINPFTGEPAPKKSGDGESYRCDGAVAFYRHCLVEFDNLSREDQIRFWSAAKLPIRALIDTAGKSIHAWLDVPKLFKVETCADWDRHIRVEFYEKVLVPMGVDRMCCNPSRLSRLPGAFRPEKNKFQKLLWLSPDGREVVR